jgi:hypothetical protein
MPGSFFRLSLKDNSREIGRSEFNIGDITAISLPGALTEMGALTDAIMALVIGVKVGTGFGDNDSFVAAPPTSKLAQRGIKWTVVGRDTVTGVPVINHIPTANLTLLPAGDAEDLVITGGVGLAFKTAYEALVKSPAGNALALERVYFSD